MVEIIENMPMPEFLQIDVSGLRDGNYFKIPVSEVRRSKSLIERLQSKAAPYGISLICLRGEEFVEFWVKRNEEQSIYEKSILNSLRDKGDYMSIKELTYKTNMNYAETRKVLIDLMKCGVVMRIDKKKNGRGRPLGLYGMA